MSTSIAERRQNLEDQINDTIADIAEKERELIRFIENMPTTETQEQLSRSAQSSRGRRPNSRDVGPLEQQNAQVTEIANQRKERMEQNIARLVLKLYELREKEEQLGE
ncbi:hypothetical protein QQS21_007095 [Conoideocrella luteorostrata]|uniref:Uncharacterized protein n=1 Tax=Conoideocrella luteorostrata TaxID=1105319 RepID=A0AAJ0CLC6_9HYPO|nr:hypothetical protein QQS21_007095 [Conoideocrella luteorostrata]